MNFKLIEPSDYKILKKYFENQIYRHSTYSLPSIIVWSGQVFETNFSIENEYLIIYDDSEKHPVNKHLILPISSNGNQPTLEYLYDLAKKLNIKYYWFVPEDYLINQGMNKVTSLFDLADDPIYEDYIYLTSDLAELKGNKYAKKRNLIHQFDKQHVDSSRINTEKIATLNAEECLIFLEKWCEDYLCNVDPDEDFTCEKQAAINMINNIELLDVNGLVIRIDGAISALGISTHLNKEMGVLIFEKAFSQIKGLYQYLDRECALRLFPGYKYINKECDMGLPNLAKAKRSYHPFMRLKSYRLTLK